MTPRNVNEASHTPRLTIASQRNSTELFQELPELTDDSSPRQEDIHDFLQERATVSQKTRDKRKRKTPKPTAANQ
ncbi:hypothetical protein ACTXT7_013787 [Hymenolepis weldensis]